MKLISFVLSLVLMSSTFANTEFGGKITLSNSTSLKKAMASMKKEESVVVLVSATVGKVCKSKGCWMTLEDKSGDVRVTFKDYSFFVPMSLIGKDVLIQGKLKSHTMSVKEAKHMAEDAGKDTSLITKPVVEYRMIASAVKVK